jgi:hypothetical protein
MSQPHNSGTPYKWLMMARKERHDGSFRKGVWLQSTRPTPVEAIEQAVRQARKDWASDTIKAFAEAVDSSGFVTVYPITARRDFEFLIREVVTEERWEEV